MQYHGEIDGVCFVGLCSIEFHNSLYKTTVGSSVPHFRKGTDEQCKDGQIRIFIEDVFLDALFDPHPELVIPFPNFG